MSRETVRVAARVRAWTRVAGRVPVTAVFLSALVVVGWWLGDVDDPTRGTIVHAASTNVANLAHHGWWTLAASAFVVTGDVTLVWLVGIGSLLAAGELLWRGRRLVTVFAAGHVGATVLVAGGIVVGVAQGWVPRTTLTATDVGVSYGVVAVAGALATWLPGWLRPGWIVVWAATLCQPLLHSPTFTDAGHACAFVIGAGTGLVLAARRDLDAVPAWRGGIAAVLAVSGTVISRTGTPGPLWVAAASLTVAILVVRTARTWATHRREGVRRSAGYPTRTAAAEPSRVSVAA